MGRTPHVNGLFESPEDHEAVRDAMQSTDSTAFRGRDFRSLSGANSSVSFLRRRWHRSPGCYCSTSRRRIWTYAIRSISIVFCAS